jgi:hypothetical protein
VVFFVGFILGTVRVLLIAPRLGETAAVLLETPVMLVASWFVCRWYVKRLGTARRIRPQSNSAIDALAIERSTQQRHQRIAGVNLPFQPPTGDPITERRVGLCQKTRGPTKDG